MPLNLDVLQTMRNRSQTQSSVVESIAHDGGDRVQGSPTASPGEDAEVEIVKNQLLKELVLGKHNEAFRWHLSAVDMRWAGISDDGTSARFMKILAD